MGDINYVYIFSSGPRNKDLLSYVAGFISFYDS